MSAAEILAIVRALQATVEVANNAGVNVAAFTDLIERTRSEGRDPTDAELQEFADSALAAIHRIGNDAD